MRWMGMQHVWGRGKGYIAFQNLRERLLGGFRCKWYDNIKMDLHEVGFGGMEWMEMVKDRTGCEHL